MKGRLALAFTKYLNIGIKDENDSDTNQLIFVTNLFSFIGYSITLLFSISAVFRDDFVLAAFLLAVSSLFFFCHNVHRFSQFGNTIKLSTRVVFLSLLLLVIYLIYSGGNANTGPLWIYLVPPVAFIFNGLRKGLITIGVFILVISFMLFYPNELLLATSYSFEFKTRLIYSFLTVSLLFGFYEYSRHRSYQEIQAISQHYEQKAMQDSLTKLPNRRGMRTHLNYEYQRTKRSRLPLTILVCDIDHFKAINDAFMHDGGDFVLAELSALFLQIIRKQDYVSRWGGEEFLFLLPETSATDAFILAEKLRATIEDAVFNYKGSEISVTVSMGLSEIATDINIDQAINIADRHLYQAKQNGRNRVAPAISHSTIS
jgi:diguanylate cyclase (GGDEF)-like protein